MRIAFILPVRYPTEKAYGVTTSESIAALREKGHYVECITRQDIEIALKGLLGTGNARNNLIGRVVSFFFSGGNIRFILWKLIFSIMASFKNRDKKPDFYWLRDIHVTLFMSIISRKNWLFCEVHHSPNIFDRAVMKLLQRNPKVVWGPIKKSLVQGFFQEQRMVLVEMSANQEFLIVGAQKEKSSDMGVIYLGNNSNFENGMDLKWVINNLLKFREKYQFIPINVVGLDKEKLFSICGDISQDIIISPRLTRDEVLKLLALSAYGIVAYPENKYYESTFPIKIVEYAATKTAIIASNTKSHKELLSQNQALFFDFNRSDSLFDCLVSAIKEPSQLERKVENAFKWAYLRSYDRRVEGVVLLMDRLTREGSGK